MLTPRRLKYPASGLSPSSPSRSFNRFIPTTRPSLPLPPIQQPTAISGAHLTFVRHCSSDSNSKCPPPSLTPRQIFEMSGQDIASYLTQSHDRLFENNRAWAKTQKEKDPEFFDKISAGQNPEYLWIGCSDSRIPAEQITGLAPGEAFIHRNIANLVNNTDLNSMSVIEYAVRHLKVKHIIVCGHYGCGGIAAAMTPKDLGILNPWLRNIRDVYRLHETELDAIEDTTERGNRLVELNVIEQCNNVIKAASVQESFAKNQFPVVHGWVFDFKDGLLKDLKVNHEAMLRDIQKIYNLVEPAVESETGDKRKTESDHGDDAGSPPKKR
ncbi:related to carbonic anhydrase [Cephalotrichum gorgonifer]|uniref:Carbonic anhydrase n=1 Tax=Cephalotrichum gorgonifer TaxID=2041049 RepID=A0AAE8N2P4_9PEZI|nr:related to carbonic anhydrase [Cephalotrichum gorgonifer]